MQQLKNLTKIISLSLDHLFIQPFKLTKRWPSDKLIIFVRFVNCCIPNSIHKSFEATRYNLCILLMAFNISSKDILLLYKLGHTPISVLSVTAVFLGHTTFLYLRCFCLPYTPYTTGHFGYENTVKGNSVKIL